MRPETRILFNAYLERQASLNKVPSAKETFSIDPSVEQQLETRIQEKADFLQKVNVVGVSQQAGEKLGLGASGPVAGRTNTNTSDRQTRDVTAFDQRGYITAQTNFDTHVPYKTLDMWAKFPDFQTKLRDKVTEQIARDRLMIGFNGVTAAAQTDLATNPLLQDVNKGWLTHIRQEAEERVLTGVKVGDHTGADYRNLDALVEDAINELLDQWHAEATDLAVIIGRRLVNDKYIGLINDADKATEKVALQTLMLNKTIGARRAVTVPFFPARSIMITSFSNLSIYWQEGTRRRLVMDNPKRDRIETYDSVNEAYVVEDMGKVALIDGIKLPSSAAGNTDGWL